MSDLTNAAKCARHCREMLGLGNRPIEDVISLLNDLTRLGVINGFRVDDAALISSSDLAKWDHITRQIVLSTKIHTDALRRVSRAIFTICHEIGHAFLGHEGELARSGGRKEFGLALSKIEAEANQFASHFLVPTNAVADPSRLTPAALASEFGVSVQMASYRLNDIQKEHRQKLRVKRELPQNVVDFLREKKRLGYDVKTDLPPED